MIKNYSDLKYYIEEDAKQSMRKNTKSRLWGDEIWKFQKNLRWYEFFYNTNRKLLLIIPKIKHHYSSIRYGIEIYPNNFEYGLWIGHMGGIVVNPKARIGHNCTILHNVTIGNDCIIDRAPQIGNNCLIGTGSVIIGDIKIGNDVKFGAGSITVKNQPNGAVLVGASAINISKRNEVKN